MEYLKAQDKEKYREEMSDLFLKSAQLIKDPKGEPKSFYGAAIAGAIVALLTSRTSSRVSSKTTLVAPAGTV